MAARGLSMTRRERPRWLERLILHAVLLCGLLVVIAAVELLALLVLGRLPTDEERTVLAVSIGAAAVAALVYQPVRARLEQVAARLLRAEREAPGEVLRAARHEVEPRASTRRAAAGAGRVAAERPSARGGRGLDRIRRPLRTLDVGSRPRLGKRVAHLHGAGGCRARRGLRPGVARRVAAGAARGSRRRTAEGRPDRQRGRALGVRRRGARARGRAIRGARRTRPGRARSAGRLTPSATSGSTRSCRRRSTSFSGRPSN